VRLERQGDVDLVDALLAHHAARRRAACRAPARRESRRRLAGIVVEEADQTEAVLVVGDELLGDLAPELAGADDEDPLGVADVDAGALQHPAQTDPCRMATTAISEVTREERQEGAAVGEVLDASGRQPRGRYQDARPESRTVPSSVPSSTETASSTRLPPLRGR
jgi:hypothetical protein